MDLSLALRSLKRTPAFTFAIILTLVLGIAAVGSMFAIVYGVLLAPLPYGNPERLVSVGLETPEMQRMGQPPALYFTYKKAQSIDDIGFYRTGNVNVSTKDGDVADSVIGTWVTASMMPLLQIPPLLGRSFTADEERRGGPQAAILSEFEWRTRFGAAPDIIGKTITVNSVTRQIVGVMPADFSFPTVDTRVWLPVKHTDSATVSEFIYTGVARLAHRATVQQAQAELSALLPRMADAFPQLESGGSTASWLAERKPKPAVLSLREELTNPIAHMLWLLTAAAGLVLLVAWANVVNLLLIRAEGRQVEIAVHVALGASRWRILGHFLGEALLLGASAGLLALLLSFAAVRALVVFGPSDIPRLAELGVGPMSVGFIVLVTIVGVLICATLPTARLRRASLSMKLRDGAHGQSAGKFRQRLRASITVMQIALALVVSVGSALLLRTAHQLSKVHPGFDANEVLTIRTQLPYARYDEADGMVFYRQLAERVSQLPAVQATGLAMRVPMAGGRSVHQRFNVGAEQRLLPVNVVDAGYFATMKIPLLAGQYFQGAAEQSADIIISQRAAATLFGDASGLTALGKRLELAPRGPSYTVIGVVADVRDHDLATAPLATVYRPPVIAVDPTVEAGAPRSMALLVRASGSSADVLPAIRQIVRELDPSVPLFKVETMSEVLRASTARLSLALTLMTVAASITLVLGMIGLYGVMAYMVALRTREFGVRVALGADPRQISRWVAGRGLLLTACGITAGFVLYALTAPLLRSFLYGVTPGDAPTLVGVTLLLAGTASVASWLPARRAALVDPALALRAE